MTSKNIVVTGATGNIGSRVVLDLAAKTPNSVIAFVRDRTKAAHLVAAGATVRSGSFEDASSLRQVFTDVDTVVLVTAGPSQLEQARAAIEAARASGVRKVVRISGAKASIDAPTEATRQAGRIETLLRESGLAYVVLRANSFMQNLLALVPTIRNQGKLFYGVGSGKMGMIDTRDIADAALAAATSDAWDGGTFELTGPATIDFHLVAAAISRELGRDVTYVPIPAEAAGEAARKHGAEPWLAQTITEFCAANELGWSDFVTNDVQKVTGHAPRSIEQFVHDVLAPAVRAS
jgi:NAD(P)H dehydrogenase (quinone)